MTRRHESHDLRKANDRHIKKLRRRARYQARTQPTRDRVRRLALLTKLCGTGVLR